MPDDSTGDRGRFRGLGIATSAAAWGFVEATFFFIVPDVLLSWLALKNPRVATIACFSALAGALLGGSVMYAWGARDIESAVGFLNHIPAINAKMLTNVQRQVDANGTSALFVGPLQGTPYKIYAVYAGAVGVSFITFLLISVPARLIRFLIVTWLTVILARYAFAYMSLGQQRVVLTISWSVFYTWYYWRMGTG